MICWNSSHLWWIFGWSGHCKLDQTRDNIPSVHSRTYTYSIYIFINFAVIVNFQDTQRYHQLMQLWWVKQYGCPSSIYNIPPNTISFTNLCFFIVLVSLHEHLNSYRYVCSCTCERFLFVPHNVGAIGDIRIRHCLSNKAEDNTQV